MSASKTLELFASREQVLSTDLVRIGKLSARELQDTAQWAGAHGDQGILPTVFDTAPVAMPGLLRTGTIEGNVGNYGVHLYPGEGFLPGSSSDPDVSAYDVVRWPEQTIDWTLYPLAMPDGANPKICLIVAYPANVAGDPLSRNILVDPTTRTVAPAIVNKTSNPVGTIDVIAGTANAFPQPPAVPAGALAVWSVYVPAGAADSSAFGFARRAHRRLEFPGTTQHGLLQGCVPKWAMTDESTNNTPFLPDSEVHRAVIDGELVSFSGAQVTAESEGLYPPVAAGTSDEVAYLYLVGGRNAPQCQLISANFCVPVRMVETLVPPDAWGRPIIDLQVNGVVVPASACLYIGPSFIVASGSKHKGCIIDGDWIRALTTAGGLFQPVPASFYEPAVTLTAGAGQDVAITTMPARATMAELYAYITEVGYYGADYFIYQEAPGGSFDLLVGHGVAVETGGLSLGSLDLRCKAAVTVSGLYFVDNNAAGVSLQLNLRATGYNLNLPRISR